MPGAKSPRSFPFVIRHSSFVIRAFTLVELLTVIAVIGVLAAMGLAVMGSVKKTAILNHAKAELAQIKTAIDNYKHDRGYYPPGNASTPATPNNYLVNQLYYELVGTTNNADRAFKRSMATRPSRRRPSAPFGVSAFMNCTRTNGERRLRAGKKLSVRSAAQPRLATTVPASSCS